MSKLHVRSVILSDVHLGTPHSKAEEVTHFLKHVRCDRLILNGDIIDGWRLRRGDPWTKSHTKFVRRVLTMIQKRDTEVVYLRGNHDDILSAFLPLEFENLRIVEDYIHESPRGRYLVLHGDVFDTVTKNFVFLAHLGDWGYRALLKLNRIYNAWRAWRGKEYWSLSKAIKARVKEAVSHVSNFEEHIAELARSRGVHVLLLETGEGPGFEGAWRLYERSGFSRRGAFFDYPDSQWSRFYEKSLAIPASA